jgi:thiosulfate/3-mercaptopyruvate sulfurtransferase
MNSRQKQAHTVLITTSQLAQLYNDKDLIIIDCRFDLSKPDWGFDNYKINHIPGAFYAHLDNDLSGEKTSKTGRHPLPDKDVFLGKLNYWRIGQNSQVVVYDTVGGAFAARLWWMLKYYGHQQAAVLDGGLQKWMRDGYPVLTGVEAPKGSDILFLPTIDQMRVVTTSEIEKLRSNPAFLIIDARTPQRFRGEIEPIDPIAGHIPGAVNRFHGDNLSIDGTMKPAEILKIVFSKLLNGKSPENVVVYCGSGVTSCHHLLAMEAAGLPGARLYAGSWSEWIRDPTHTIATGET